MFQRHCFRATSYFCSREINILQQQQKDKEQPPSKFLLKSQNSSSSVEFSMFLNSMKQITWNTGCVINTRSSLQFSVIEARSSEVTGCQRDMLYMQYTNAYQSEITNYIFLGRLIRCGINLLNKPISKMYLKENTGIYILAFLLALNTQNN